MVIWYKSDHNWLWLSCEPFLKLNTGALNFHSQKKFLKCHKALFFFLRSSNLEVVGPIIQLIKKCWPYSQRTHFRGKNLFRGFVLWFQRQLITPSNLVINQKINNFLCWTQIPLASFICRQLNTNPWIMFTPRNCVCWLSGLKTTELVHYARIGKTC